MPYTVAKQGPLKGVPVFISEALQAQVKHIPVAKMDVQGTNYDIYANAVKWIIPSTNPTPAPEPQKAEESKPEPGPVAPIAEQFDYIKRRMEELKREQEPKIEINIHTHTHTPTPPISKPEDPESDDWVGYCF